MLDSGRNALGDHLLTPTARDGTLERFSQPVSESRNRMILRTGQHVP